MALVENLTHSMLYQPISGLPSNSYRLAWEKIVPEQRKKSYKAGEEIRFAFRASTNKYLMSDKSQFACSLRATATVATGITDAADSEAFARQLTRNPLARPVVNVGLPFISSTSETVNNGGLCVYEQCSKAWNHMYVASSYASRRNLDLNSEDHYTDPVNATNVIKNDNLSDGTDFHGSSLHSSEAAGFGTQADRSDGIGLKVADGVIVGSGKGSSYSVSLSALSRIAAGLNDVPVGYFSNESAGSWQLSMEMAPNGDVISVPQGDKSGLYAADGTTVKPVTWTVGDYEVCDPCIYACFLEVFDANYNQGIKNLYDRTASLEYTSEGVTRAVPESLVLPTIGWSDHQTVVPQGTDGQINLAIPSNHRSVRGIMMRMVPQSQLAKKQTVTSDGFPYNYFSGGSAVFTSLHVNAGTGSCLQKCSFPSDCADDCSPAGMAAWLVQQVQNAGYLFSPESYHSERVINNGQVGAGDAFYRNLCLPKPNVQDESQSVGCSLVVVGFDNHDNVGETAVERVMGQGLDMSQIGTLHLKIGVTSMAGIGEDSNGNIVPSTGPLTEPYVCLVRIAYDATYMVTRSGVKDVSAFYATPVSTMD